MTRPRIYNDMDAIQKATFLPHDAEFIGVYRVREGAWLIAVDEDTYDNEAKLVTAINALGLALQRYAFEQCAFGFPFAPTGDQVAEEGAE